MREKIRTFFCFCIIICVLPVLITIFCKGISALPDREEQFAENENNKAKEVLTDEVLGEELASQIKGTAPIEAIKAQAVIVRTQFYYEQENGKKESDNEYIKSKVQREIDNSENVYVNAMKMTEGEIIVYDGKPINAQYHALSAGWTRAVEGCPYLAGAECAKDVEAEGYLNVKYIDQEEFAAEIENSFLDTNIDYEEIKEDVKILKRDSSEYVTKVQLGDNEVSGDEFRQAFGLLSDCFYISFEKGKIRIVTKGLGHGIGLSQNTAIELAEQGNNYCEILQYFFKDCEVVPYKKY